MFAVFSFRAFRRIKKQTKKKSGDPTKAPLKLQKGAADDCRRVTSAQSDRAAVRSSAGRGRRCLDAHTRRA